MDSVSLIEIAVAVAVMFAASTVFTSLGFGIGLVGLPLLLLVFDTQTAVIIINTTAMPLVLLIFLNTRQNADLKQILPIGLLGMVGALLGAVVLTSANETALRIAILILILTFTAISAFNVQIPVPKPRLMGPIIGFIVGLLITAVGIGGPLLVLFMLALSWHRHTVRASMSLFFLFMMTTAVVGYTAGGLYTPSRLLLVGAAFVPAIAGFYLGNRIAHGMNERVFRYFVVSLITFSSLVVLSREIVNLMNGQSAV